ncbi:hypothetical protein JW992_08610 [candidate division KSB1 bacterium]|nr:hypothetical protein [candidate division KSB1 bacterium]
MEMERKVKLLQQVYVAALADSVRLLNLSGGLTELQEIKRREQFALGAHKCRAFGIESPERVFTALAELFNCADWRIEKTDDGINAVAKSCQLCGLARKMGAPSPCRLYCLDPMQGMVSALDPQAEFTVECTLWDSECCRVHVRTTATDKATNP